MLTPRHFKAANLFTSKDKARPILGTVALFTDPEGEEALVATDSYRMFCTDLDVLRAATEPPVMFTSASVTATCKVTTDLAATREDFVLTLARLTDFEYPNVKGLVPATLPEGLPCPVRWNTKFLADIDKATRILDPQGYADFIGAEDANRPSWWSLPLGCSVLLMPVRTR